MNRSRRESQRLTVPLPLAPGHVHCYVVEGDEGRLLVDTGLALPGLDDLFREELDGPVDRIVITHFHPDHVWGGEIARAVTGAPVHQGRLDYAQCESVWQLRTGRSGSPTGSVCTASRRR